MVLPVSFRNTSFSVGFLRLTDTVRTGREWIIFGMNSSPFSVSSTSPPFSSRALIVKFFLYLLDRPLIVGGHQMDDVAVHHLLESRGRVQRDDPAVVDDGDAVAVLRLFHVVGRHEDGDLLFFPERVDEVPDGVPRLRVEAQGRLVQEQHAGIVEEPPGDLEPALHAAGKVLDQVVLAALELDHGEHLVDPLLREARGPGCRGRRGTSGSHRRSGPRRASCPGR